MRVVFALKINNFTPMLAKVKNKILTNKNAFVTHLWQQLRIPVYITKKI